MGLIGRVLFSAAVIVFFASPALYSADFCSKHLADSGATAQAIEHALGTARVLRLTPMPAFLKSAGKEFTGSNEIYLLELEGGLRGVWKIDEKGKTIDAEIGGYRFSEFLGVQLVPPTVRRTHAGRVGSLQLYIETTRDLTQDGGFRKAFAKLSEKAQSDLRIVQFVSGKWDNHNGNMLITDADEPVLIDNEDIHTLQQVRYGEFPFLKRGRTRGDSKNGAPGPFPFDAPSELKAPTMEMMRATFGQYWHEEGIARLHSKLRSTPNQTIRYAIWNGSLWISNARTWSTPPHTTVYSRQTLAALRRLNAMVLTTSILPRSFTPTHVEGILDRARQVLEAAKSGRLIP